MAILLLLLVATSLVVLGMAFGHDAKRTTTLSDEAQLRQLLTAGAIAAMNEKTSLPLPADLQSRGATLTITAADDVATITATLANRRMTQTVRFERRAAKLIPLDARLTD